MFDKSLQINPIDAVSYSNKGKIINYVFQEMHLNNKQNLIKQLRCMIVFLKSIQKMQSHILIKVKHE